MKKIIGILISFTMLFTMITPAFAETQTNEWYSMEEEEFTGVIWVGPDDMEPYSLYLASVSSYIARISSGKVGLRADVVCYSTVSKITATFYLQKLSGGKWYNVSSGVASATNVSSMSKSMSVSGLPSGTYRTKVVIAATDKYGYTETKTGYSAGINI